MSTKYEELYKLAKEDFSAEVERLTRVESKAFGLLSVLTLLVGLYGLVVEWLGSKVIPPTACLEWIIILLAIAVLIGLVVSWIFVFRVLTIDRRATISVNEVMCKFYVDNSLIDIYFAMARRISEGAAHNRSIVQTKVHRLTIGYWSIIVTGTFIVLLTVCMGAHTWLNESDKQPEQTFISRNNTGETI